MRGIGHEFASFLVIGAGATACHYALLIALVEILRASAVPASAAGAALGAGVSYVLNRKLTFRSDRTHRAALPRFFTVAALSLVANTAFMALLTGPAGLPYLAAQAFTTVLLIVLTFGANKLWTFGNDGET